MQQPTIDWPGGKAVIVNDWLPDNAVLSFPDRIVVSPKGWKRVQWWLEGQEHIAAHLPRIIESELGDVLVWLREAGHDV
jgi:hypothetical protein